MILYYACVTVSINTGLVPQKKRDFASVYKSLITDAPKRERERGR
jgi:hypothetical protein